MKMKNKNKINDTEIGTESESAQSFGAFLGGEDPNENQKLETANY